MKENKCKCGANIPRGYGYYNYNKSIRCIYCGRVNKMTDKKEEITLSALLEHFGKAIILDFNKQNVWVLKDKKLKVYSKDVFKKILNGLNFFDFKDDLE